MEEFFIRMAQEPLWKDRGAPQTEYRTHERYAQLYKLYMENGKKYRVEFGNERGPLEDKAFDDRSDANSRFDEYVSECEMKEDSWKTVQEENSKMSLKEIVECYFKAGDYLREGMDDWLDRIKADAHVQYRYKNLYSNSSGFLAKVIMWKSTLNGEPFTDRVEIFIENDGMGHMVRNIQST